MKEREREREKQQRRSETVMLERYLNIDAPDAAN